MGFEPATLHTQGTEFTTKPPHPISLVLMTTELIIIIIIIGVLVLLLVILFVFSGFSEIKDRIVLKIFEHSECTALASPRALQQTRPVYDALIRATPHDSTTSVSSLGQSTNPCTSPLEVGTLRCLIHSYMHAQASILRWLGSRDPRF